MQGLDCPCSVDQEDAMNQILSYPLWIGHGGEGHNFPLLFETGIEAVIELAAEEPALPSSRDLISADSRSTMAWATDRSCLSWRFDPWRPSLSQASRLSYAAQAA